MPGRKFVVRLLTGLVMIAGVLVSLAIAEAAPRAKEEMVNIQGFAFNPGTITINVGDSVMWTNNDSAPHTVTAQDKSFDSGNMATGANFSFTFSKAGTYQYVCAYHDTMAGTIQVQDAAPAAAPAPQAAPTGMVEANDQPLVNMSVTVAKVTSSADGWIVVHLDENNRPGKVLGHTAIKAGDNMNVVVQLSEEVPAGGKVWPMLHVDLGQAGVYEFPGADVPVRMNDMVVMKQITITAADAAPAAPAAPAQLPTTGGGEGYGMLLAAAIALLLGGAAVSGRIRRNR